MDGTYLIESCQLRHAVSGASVLLHNFSLCGHVSLLMPKVTRLLPSLGQKQKT